jgi:hypothetical protein
VLIEGASVCAIDPIFVFVQLNWVIIWSGLRKKFSRVVGEGREKSGRQWRMREEISYSGDLLLIITRVSKIPGASTGRYLSR